MSLRLYLIAGFILAALTAGAVYTLKIYNAGADSVVTKSMKQTIEDIRERNIDDVETQNLSDFDICVRDFGELPECAALK